MSVPKNTNKNKANYRSVQLELKFSNVNMCNNSLLIYVLF